MEKLIVLGSPKSINLSVPIPVDNRTKKEEEERSWSDLHVDILELIASRLNISELIQSSRASKHWRSTLCMAPKSRLISYGTPCLLRFSSTTNTRILLTDPLRDENFIIDAPSMPTDEMMLIACSNRGWLLIISLVQYAFFFNPLTQQTVHLPKEGRPMSSAAFNFTAPPTSPACVVVGLVASHNYSWISYCRPGDERWTRFYVYHEGIDFTGSHSSPLFFKNKIYHLDMDGRVGVYDVAPGTVTMIGKCMRGKPEDWYSISHRCRHHLVDIGGELISAFVDVDEGMVHLYKFDDSNDSWIKLDGVGDERLLFLGAVDCVWTKAAAVGAARRRGENIFLRFSYEKEPKPFSCASKEIRTLQGDDFLQWRLCACWIELMA